MDVPDLKNYVLKVGKPVNVRLIEQLISLRGLFSMPIVVRFSMRPKKNSSARMGVTKKTD